MKISRFNILWHIVFLSSFLTFTIALPLGDITGGGGLGDFWMLLRQGVLSYGVLYLLLRKNYGIGRFWGVAINSLGAVISLAIATLIYGVAILSCSVGGCIGTGDFIHITFLLTSSMLTFLLGYMRLASRWKMKPLISTIIFSAVVIIALFFFLDQIGALR